jgi:hypothetical protein
MKLTVVLFGLGYILGVISYHAFKVWYPELKKKYYLYKYFQNDRW